MDYKSNYSDLIPMMKDYDIQVIETISNQWIVKMFNKIMYVGNTELEGYEYIDKVLQNEIKHWEGYLC